VAACVHEVECGVEQDGEVEDRVVDDVLGDELVPCDHEVERIRVAEGCALEGDAVDDAGARCVHGDSWLMFRRLVQ